MNERRGCVRKPELIIARARLHPGDEPTAVIVKNVSRTGAKLSLPTTMKLPDHFELDVPALGFTAQVSVRWRLEQEVGVVFLTSSPRPRVRSESTLARLFDLERQLARVASGH